MQRSTLLTRRLGFTTSTVAMSATPSGAQLWSWLATAVLTGAIAMGLELTAFRLYAPYFGYSVYVWGTMISVVMLAMAVGYGVGGRLSASGNAERSLYATILFSAAYQLCVLFILRFFLPWISGKGEFTGTAIATIVIFAPSMGALAATGPLIVRLCSRCATAGPAAGRVYALSTIGSAAGILCTSFLLVPQFGTHATLSLLCLATFVTAGWGLALSNRVWMLAMLPAAGLLVAPGLGWSLGTVWTTESAYNLIRVVRSGNQTALLLNSNKSAHTIRQGSDRWTGYYYDYFALGPKLAHSTRALVLGMGAGGSIGAIRATAPEIAIDAVEIDPKVVDAARQWFGIDKSDPHLQIHVEDARPWLTGNRSTYDVVELDLYQGGPYIPFYLATQEFFRLVRAHMTDDGVVMMNVFDPSPSGELVNSMAATMRQAFSSVMAVRMSRGNHMLFGFPRKREVDDVRHTLAGIDEEGRLQEIAENASAGIADVRPGPAAVIFTDDRAPVEEMTRRVLAHY